MSLTELKAKLPLITEHLKTFFSGRLYPALVALLTLVGHISGLEFYFNILNMLAACAALMLSSSFVSVLPFMLTVVFQVNLKHSPGVPTWSDYYYTTGKLITIVTLCVLLAAALVCFIARVIAPKIKRDGIKNIPLLLPTSLLCLAFLLNGVGGQWTLSGLIYGTAQVLIYFLLFYIVYYGLEEENSERLFDRITYLALLVSGVIIGEMIFMLATYDGIFVDGSLVKESINLGWGIWNPIAFSLTVLIPLLMRGAMVSDKPWLYLGASVLTWGFAILTLSRNALIFATLTLGACMIIACFKAKKKKAFRIITLSLVGFAAVAALLLFDKIYSIFADLFSRGFSDNGRFTLWKIGIQNFLSAPIFGKGFFSYGETEVFKVAAFIPTLAHNTLVEMLSACGIFGIIAYIFYRISTVMQFIRKPSFDKLMLSLPILVTLAMSLLDNFVFHFYTVFWYLICLAFALKMQKRD